MAPSTATPSPAHEELVAYLASKGHLGDPRLEEAMLDVPRHLFVPEEFQDESYDDHPLPVGLGQTISAPHMVAMMTTALSLEEGQSVLEIGTGFGYHAAVLKAMVGKEGKVVSIEYLPELAAQARLNLAEAEADVKVIDGDGYLGAPDHAPFDAIIVTCAIPRIPQALIDQLRDGGHLSAPIGHTDCVLIIGRKVGAALDVDELGGCRFVNAQGRLSGGADLVPST